MFDTNSSAYKQAIDTLTTIDQKIIEQKFYDVDITDFVDIEIGRGGVSDEIMNWALGDIVGTFEEGSFGGNIDFERTASADVVINKKIFPRLKWKKSVTYSLFDIMQASKAQNIDIIEAKLSARKRNWDLGIQETVFLGSKVNSDITGLLNNKEVTVDTTIITKALSTMTSSEFNAVIAKLPNAFFTNANGTTIFNRFIIPSTDYNGLVTQMSETYPLKTKLEVLENALATVAKGYGENDFKIVPVYYADSAKNKTDKNIYCLYRKNPDTLVYDMAYEYNTTAFNSLNNFDFVNIGYGMYGSVNVLRPKELVYLQY